MEYGQFCPIAKATEIIGDKWTLLIIRELLMGGSRFNELQRGLSLISPTILSKRLEMLTERGLRILEALDRVAEERGVGLATISLAWLIQRPSLTAPIASATNLDQLRELMLAPELTLNSAEIALLDRASAEADAA